MKDETLILVDMARKAVNQVKAFVTELLESKMDETRAQKLAQALSSGLWTHDYPITVEKLKGFALPVQVGLPREVYSLMGTCIHSRHSGGRVCNTSLHRTMAEIQTDDPFRLGTKHSLMSGLLVSHQTVLITTGTNPTLSYREVC